MSRDDDNKNSRLRVLPTYFLRTKPTSENALHARFFDVRFGCLENYRNDTITDPASVLSLLFVWQGLRMNVHF